MGGENHRRSAPNGIKNGSSPRGRGKRDVVANLVERGRLIPAWAGKTWTHTSSPERYWAHPRVGGENCTVSKTNADLAGSSPRGRGKRPRPDRSSHLSGLIPAWAGKTIRRAFRGRRSGAHPRVGGENTLRQGAGPLMRGSSPRGRGKRHQQAEPDQRGRLIPAWAGKTRPACPPWSRRSAHPRVGGENAAPAS